MTRGVVLINKEQGFTSFDVVAVCRKIFGQKAVGHTGTLDPMATGVLPVLLGRATKLSDYLTSKEKSYEVEMELGYSTDSDDITGKEIARDEKSLSSLTEEMVKDALMKYQGDFLQVPPSYAAIKKDGRKLYEYARAGVEVSVPPRPVTVYSLEIREIHLPKVRFFVHCSKGTYIRSICRDVGAYLGCGGVMTALTRASTSGFTLSDCFTLQQLKDMKEEGRLDEAVLSMDVLLREYPKLSVLSEKESLLLNGNPLREDEVTGDLLAEGLIHGAVYRIYRNGEIAALYRYDEKRRLLMNEKMLMELTLS